MNKYLKIIIILAILSIVLASLKLASVGNNVYIAWYDTGVNYNGNAKLIFRRRIDGGNTFQNPVSLSSTVSFVSFSIAAMGNNLYVLWEDSGKKVSFRRSTDGR